MISKFELAGALGEQMATVDGSAPRAEARQAEVVQLHAREPLAEPTDEPAAAEVAEADGEAVAVELEGHAERDVEETVEAPVNEIEPLQPTVEPAAAEPVAIRVVPEPKWPEGDYVPPARPRPTLGAGDAPVVAGHAPELRTALCLAFVSTPGGYVVVPVGREAPEIGEAVDVEGYGEARSPSTRPVPAPGRRAHVPGRRGECADARLQLRLSRPDPRPVAPYTQARAVSSAGRAGDF